MTRSSGSVSLIARIAAAPRRRRHRPLCLRRLYVRDTEQDHRGNSQGVNLLTLPHGPLHRQLRDAGHRRNRLRLVLARADKQRVDKISRLQRGFANELSQSLVAPQSSRPINRKIHVALQVRSPRPPLLFGSRWKKATMARTNPDMVNSTATISARPPRSSTVRAVIGPIQARALAAVISPRLRSPKSRTKFFTVLELVKATTSTLRWRNSSASGATSTTGSTVR